MRGVIELIPTMGEAMACRSLGITRGELRRQRLRALAANIMGPPVPRQPRSSALALSEAERQLVLNTLGSERFALKPFWWLAGSFCVVMQQPAWALWLLR